MYTYTNVSHHGFYQVHTLLEAGEVKWSMHLPHLLRINTPLPTHVFLFVLQSNLFYCYSKCNSINKWWKSYFYFYCKKTNSGLYCVRDPDHPFNLWGCVGGGGVWGWWLCFFQSIYFFRFATQLKFIFATFFFYENNFFEGIKCFQNICFCPRKFASS